jgi:hypothetical protein
MSKSHHHHVDKTMNLLNQALTSIQDLVRLNPENEAFKAAATELESAIGKLKQGAVFVPPNPG